MLHFWHKVRISDSLDWGSIWHSLVRLLHTCVLAIPESNGNSQICQALQVAVSKGHFQPSSYFF